MKKKILVVIAIVIVMLCGFVGCGGNEEPTKSEYTITISPMTNGSITSNKTKATKFELVLLTITPSNGYKLKEDSLKINGEIISEDRFLMPSEDVTVSAEFIEKDMTEYTITINSMTNGTVVPSKAKATAGETITLTITPNSGYKLEIGTLKFNETAILGNTFAMPSESVTISAGFVLGEASVLAGKKFNLTDFNMSYTASATAERKAKDKQDAMETEASTITENSTDQEVLDFMCQQLAEVQRSFFVEFFETSVKLQYVDVRPYDYELLASGDINFIENGQVVTDITGKYENDNVTTITTTKNYIYTRVYTLA